jgi:hypothetical protein
MRWRGSSAEHVCWRRSAVRWAWGRTGPFRRAPATTPSPSEPAPSLQWRPLGRALNGFSDVGFLSLIQKILTSTFTIAMGSRPYLTGF